MCIRDRSDTTRTISPLTAAEQAVRIDTTDLTIDEVVDRVMALVHQSLADRALGDA